MKIKEINESFLTMVVEKQLITCFFKKFLSPNDQLKTYFDVIFIHEKIFNLTRRKIRLSNHSKWTKIFFFLLMTINLQNDQFQ